VSVNDAITGCGWRFPILPDRSGTLGYVQGDENVEQSLRILLLTALGGERVMRADFGSAAPRLVFAPGSTHFLGLLETTVRDAVRDWEPRVDLESVRAEVIGDAAGGRVEDENRVTVSIAYRVRRTNTRQNLVFPFYLNTVRRP
jgi:Bacteriophage baseplate protein W